MSFEWFKKNVLLIGIISWTLSWIILGFKLDLITYIGFVFYGLGVSGITIYFTINAIELKEKEESKR